MPKANTKPKAYTPPPEVRDADPPLPPELANQGPLTATQKKKDEKRRDDLMRLHNSAARLNADEQTLAHAQVRTSSYEVELARLIGMRAMGIKERGGIKKTELERVIKATAHNLAEALCDQGLYPEAFGVLDDHTPKAPELATIIETMHAINRDDADHCACPATEQFVAKRLYIPERARHVDLVVCRCGHWNATEQLPPQLATLHAAVAAAPKRGATDTTILKIAEKLQPRGGS